MTLYNSLYPQLEAMGLEQWAHELKQVIPERMAVEGHGTMPLWQKALQGLPQLKPSKMELKTKVEIGCPEDLVGSTPEEFSEQLQAFHPWRKGPYNLFGVDVDTEWRSDWKWDRVQPHIQSLKGRKILDIGCGNGYHGWRMLGEGADLVVGIDPTLLSVMQFHVVQRYLVGKNHYVLPLGIEDVPADLACFDTVFSMGVLYHRRSPLDHLMELRGCLQPGGELVLETLIVEGEEGTAFMPEGRYAKMRNVWFLPSTKTMLLWLRRCGFKDVACVDISRTSVKEQRRTEWMKFESLADFLDPKDHTKTIEGHPAPLRAIFTATKS
ncbi:MAG: tRNA 5-methoxyuridine(34)/uridine 5-oxyacetic acid(34) synthase CmoB [Desulfuromonadales bacterium]|jgi:tRNA (mo5U34)-methyltransferase|nr:tRNA 5-methoxyuridine(34)/uridine 5-oxyacetic acid(34) synthase CmoB [Desulfuromonadales bacterium]MDH4025269.1 tRNA 5-methoxyuridine(34)/uridine 5-oxyacetic acid(34) synthase CmoB [Desulfuromonadales bacterium]HKJ28594.1 tRNA 5-methoxyuridine(34)/uridine 5-oxyacetic acid(34) synthase CmoB [Desulfuromonadales bacterium]